MLSRFAIRKTQNCFNRMLQKSVAMSARMIIDAASVILVRHPGGQPETLIGRRSSNAVFMPGRYVFPGGRLEDADFHKTPVLQLDDKCIDAMGHISSPSLAYPLLNCAIRELEEETGNVITGVAETLSEFHHATSTCFPNNHAIRLICRAVTPPGYIRRFDARFFLVDAGMVNISGTTLETSHACDELEDLHWAPLSSVRAYNIAFITRRIISLAVNNLAGCQAAQYHHVEAGLPMVADLHYPGSHQCLQ